MASAAVERAELLGLVARAATPMERAAGGHFRPAPNQDRSALAAREDAWIQAVAAGDAKRFESHLSERGLTLDTWRSGLAEVVVDPTPPPWGELLLRLIDRWDDAAPANPADRPVGPIVAQAGAELDTTIADLARLEVGDQARRDLLDYLRYRLLSAAGGALRQDMQAAAAMGLATGMWHPQAYPRVRGGLEDWLSRWRRWPALARLMAVAYLDWTVAAFEMLRRLDGDLELIADVYFDGRPPGPLERISCGAGDVHDGGRSVAILTFARGRVVYKPKDLRVTDAVGRLVERSPESCRLRAPKFVRRNGYGWEAFVERTDCADVAEFGRFYHRLGGWLRLLQLLGGNDFWFDNLIAAGADPVFVDFETVSQPALPAGRFGSLAPHDRQLMEGSALGVGILPLPVAFAAGVDATDLGCLAPPGLHRSPFRTQAFDSFGHLPPSEDFETRDGFVWWRADAYVPRVGATLADPCDHMDEFVAGYTTIHGWLAGPGGRSAVERLIDEVGDAPVRVILVDTFTCYQLVNRSVAPRFLTDGVAREISMWEGVSRFLHHSPCAAASAVDAIRRLDIPLFLAGVDSRDLRDPEAGTIDGGYFAGDAATAVRRRLATIGEQDLERETALLLSGFSARRDRPRRPTAQLDAPTPAFDPLAVALGIGERIAGLALHDEPGPAWIGRIWFPGWGGGALLTLPHSLISGTCGLALLFAELKAATGRPDFDAVLAPLLDAIANDREETFAIAGRVPVGAGIGAGARIYTLCKVGSLAGWPRHVERAAAIAARLAADPDSWAPLQTSDFVAGSSGLLLALAAARDLCGHAAFAQLAGVVVAKCAREPHHELPIAASLRSTLLTRFPGPELSWRLAARAWPELAPRLPRPGLPADVSGNGNLLARLALEDPADEAFPAELERALEGDLGNARSLELLDRLWLANAAGERWRGGRAHADQLASALYARYAATGTWFPDDFCDDRYNLTASEGLAAIAIALVRLNDRRTEAAPRLL